MFVGFVNLVKIPFTETTLFCAVSTLKDKRPFDTAVGMHRRHGAAFAAEHPETPIVFILLKVTDNGAGTRKPPAGLLKSMPQKSLDRIRKEVLFRRIRFWVYIA